MPYIQETVKAGKTIEIKKYYTSRYYSKSEKRRKRKKPTEEKVKRINFRNRVRKLTWILNDNFHPGDMHLRLSYRKGEEPETKEEMQKMIRNFLEKMRREYRKAGKELKYVHVFEIGKRGARHHHLVINSIDTEVLRKCWPHGYIHTSLLDSSGQYKKLAEYLLKYSGRNIGKWTGKSYSKSKNLTIPVPEKKIISKRTLFREEARPKKGYYIDQGTIECGETVYGYKFFGYIMIRLERGKDG